MGEGMSFGRWRGREARARLRFTGTCDMRISCFSLKAPEFPRQNLRDNVELS